MPGASCIIASIDSLSARKFDFVNRTVRRNFAGERSASRRFGGAAFSPTGQHVWVRARFGEFHFTMDRSVAAGTGELVSASQTVWLENGAGSDRSISPRMSIMQVNGKR
jgi:hypothetical protein